MKTNRIFLGAFALGFFLSFVISNDNAAFAQNACIQNNQGGQISYCLCHNSGSKQNSTVTLVIAEPAVCAHFKNHADGEFDSPGACADEDDPVKACTRGGKLAPPVPEDFSCGETPCEQDEECLQGDACTTPSVCSEEGVCVPGEAIPDCQTCENSEECPAGDECTAPSQCEDGVCQPGEPIPNCGSCETADDCPPSDECTTAPTCSEGTCVPGEPIPNCQSCDDCVSCESSNDCFAGDTCNGPSACVDGVCQPSSPTDCNDSSTCSDDFCSNQNGCQHVDNGSCPESDGTDTCVEPPPTRGGVTGGPGGPTGNPNLFQGSGPGCMLADDSNAKPLGFVWITLLIACLVIAKNRISGTSKADRPYRQ